MTDETKEPGGLFAYIMSRLGESSTWRGFVTALTATGLVLTPQQADFVLTAGLGLHAFLSIFFPDGKKAAK